MDKEKYVELIRFRSLTEAYITKGLLDSAGIPNEVMNDLIYGTVPSAESGVRIVVNENDYELAKKIIDTRGEVEIAAEDIKDSGDCRDKTE